MIPRKTIGEAVRVVQGEVGAQKWARKIRFVLQVKKDVKYTYVVNESNCLGVREQCNSTSVKSSMKLLPQMDVSTYNDKNYALVRSEKI
uniref:Putative ovule protein n=1 Tax=Solanum chacoense TaxID=4108 RepID=A0A0V0IQ96_SOLCH